MAETPTLAKNSTDLLTITRWIRQMKLPWIPIVIMVVLVICAVFAPLLAPHDPLEIDLLNSRMAPGADWSYPLGTDIMGRDMLSRMIFN